MTRRLYDVKEIKYNVFGVYSKDFGSKGGWDLLMTFPTEEDANNYIVRLIKLVKLNKELK